MNAPTKAPRSPVTELAAPGQGKMTIRRARRPVRVSMPPDYACEFDSLMLVALSTKRQGHMVLLEQLWRD